MQVRIFIFRVLTFFIYCGIINTTFGQEQQFSQYYNLAQLQNPAFVGTSYALRGILHSRIQWAGLESRYISSVASVDYNLAKYNSGLGIILLHDDQGASSIKTFKSIVQYAYQVALTPGLSLRSGVSMGFSRRVLSNEELYYPDQFNGNGFNDGNRIPSLSKNYLDLTAGLLLYSDKFWFGFSSAHLNSPNQSFAGNIDKIPRRFDFNIGYKFVLKSTATMRYLENEDEDIWAVYPTLLYKSQGKADQLDIGLYSIYKIFKTGIWYRGIPVKNYSHKILNHESLVALVGIKLNDIQINYSYDMIISKLSQYSHGSHEINITILYPKRKNFKARQKSLPCPEFYGKKGIM